MMRVLKTASVVVIATGALIGMVGILMSLIVVQDYEADQFSEIKADARTYEVRRYSFGFATTSDTRYTFDTYRTFGLLPVEHRIDRTDLFGSRSDLDVASVRVAVDNKSRQIAFIAANGRRLIKELD